MFGSRRNRPSLIGRAAHTAARTAVIAGTATAVSGAVAGRQAAKAGQVAAPPPVTSEPAPAAGLAPEAIEQLKQLADLNRQGILTDEEFATQKARLLG